LCLDFMHIPHPPPGSQRFPYTTLFRSRERAGGADPRGVLDLDVSAREASRGVVVAGERAGRAAYDRVVIAPVSCVAGRIDGTLALRPVTETPVGERLVVENDVPVRLPGRPGHRQGRLGGRRASVRSRRGEPDRVRAGLGSWVAVGDGHL